MRFTLISAFLAVLAVPFAAAQRPGGPGPGKPGPGGPPSEGGRCPQFAPGPVTPSFIAANFFNPTPKSLDLASIEAIRQVAALYALAIDGRDFEALREVFTDDARANYSDPIGELQGVQAIIDALPPGLTVFPSTQHHLGTQYIQICGPNNAVSVTYFQASHYFVPYTGVGDTIGNDQVLIDRAQYQDVWGRQRDGKWKITNRNLVRMVCIHCLLVTRLPGIILTCI